MWFAEFATYPENFFKILERPTEANGAIGLNYACQQQLRSQKKCAGEYR